MKNIILKGPRLTLRPIKLSDAADYVRWFKDKRVVLYMGESLYRISLAKEKEYIRAIQRKKNDLFFSIIAEDGKHIGDTALHLNQSNKRAGFGLLIGDKRYWGRGYAGECIKILGDFIFKEMKYNRFELSVVVSNKRAVRAYEKAGFKKEGVLRKHLWSKIERKFNDQYVMSILRPEWIKRYKT